MSGCQLLNSGDDRNTLSQNRTCTIRAGVLIMIELAPYFAQTDYTMRPGRGKQCSYWPPKSEVHISVEL